MEPPVIGAWTAMLKATSRFGPDYATASFHPDGTMTITISGYTAHGAWQAADSGTVRFRAVAPLGPAEGQTGWQTLAFDVQVAPDGSTLSLDGTYAHCDAIVPTTAEAGWASPSPFPRPTPLGSHVPLGSGVHAGGREERARA